MLDYVSIVESSHLTEKQDANFIFGFSVELTMVITRKIIGDTESKDCAAFVKDHPFQEEPVANTTLTRHTSVINGVPQSEKDSSDVPDAGGHFTQRWMRAISNVLLAGLTQ
jgi:hypothetical protein